MPATLAKKPEEIQAIVPAKTETGQPIFSVLVKRTYDIQAGKTAVRSDTPHPLIATDIYYDDGDPETTSVKFETDLPGYKLATDVVLVGKAYAPGSKPVTQVNVGLQVGPYLKKLQITGDRQCRFRGPQVPAFTDPVPFTEMEVRYERAYGGIDTKSIPDLEFHYPRNPLGRGLVLKNVRELVENLPLPNVEDSEDLLTPERVVLGEPERWNKQPLPQGYGWFHRAWYPRCSFVGAVPGLVNLEEPMREELLGLVPRGQMVLARQFRLPSFDARFNNGASLGLVLPYLEGNEAVHLTNLTPEGDLKLSLPGAKPRMSLDLGQGEKALQVVLHTLLLQPEQRKLDLVWRGSLEYPGLDWVPNIKKMAVSVE